MSSNASNHPVQRPRHERSTDDYKIDQKPTIADREDLDSEITLAPPRLTKDYCDALAFNEDPVTILIHPTAAKNAPRVVDCWVNGRGAEAVMNGKWHVLGWLPVGVPVITKRKYVEVLLKSKNDAIDTRVVQHKDFEENLVDRSTSLSSPLQVIRDDNPKGAEWLAGAVSFN